MTKNEDTARMCLNGTIGLHLLDTTVASACIFGPGLNGNTYSYYGITVACIKMTLCFNL